MDHSFSMWTNATICQLYSVKFANPLELNAGYEQVLHLHLLVICNREKDYYFWLEGLGFEQN
jgi:hypothetical protein